MRRFDYIFVAILILLVIFLVYPLTHNWFFGFTDQYRLLGGFIKFFLFASLGDLISWRFVHKNYRVKGFIYKAIVWGIIGVIIVFIFGIYSQGVYFLQEAALLPFSNVPLMTAFFISLLMNFTFAPTMMLFHRISDHYIEHKTTNTSHRLNLTLKNIDYHGFIQFVVFKTIPLFWLPAHTITFILPSEYRVFFAALLGIALGLILGFAKHVNIKER